VKKKAKKGTPKKKTKTSVAAKRGVKKVAKRKAAAPIRAAALSQESVGILGGSFNPIHVGHLNSALTVREKLNLNQMILVPSATPPMKEFVGPTGVDRLALVDAAIKPYRPELESSDLEIKRGGVSYTVDTLKALGKTYRADKMYFIMGADAFQSLPRWKSVGELLKLANFVVTTRPGTELTFDDTDALPEGLAGFIKSVSENKILLKTGREILKVELEDKDVSATEIRKRLRMGQNTKEWLPEGVLQAIDERNLYKKSSPLVKDYREFALYLARKALDKKALALKIYDMSRMNSYADYSLICSATSSRHGASLAEIMMESAKQDYGITPLSLDGLREGQWVLFDYGAVVVHIFQDAVRSQYNIEGLWKKCSQFQGELGPQGPGPASPSGAKPVPAGPSGKEMRQR
jgi:nicotinate-nucleotide adenylyltransferase